MKSLMKYGKYAVAALLGFGTTRVDLDPETWAMLEALAGGFSGPPPIVQTSDPLVEPPWATNLFLQLKQENIALRDVIRSVCQ